MAVHRSSGNRRRSLVCITITHQVVEKQLVCDLSLLSWYCTLVLRYPQFTLDPCRLVNPRSLLLTAVIETLVLPTTNSA